MGEAKQDRFRVVVGVDFSQACNHAVLEAMRLADRVPRSTLHFVHVLEVGPDLHDAELIDELSESLGRAMTRLERHVRDTLYVLGVDAGWGSELMYHVRVGPVARELHQVAVDADADLVVVGEPQRGTLRKLFHRSSAEELVRSAHVPVVVAHPKDFRGMAKSPEPEPPRPGQDVTQSGTYATVDFYDNGRGTHISGMI
jgi:nucleotide-binding universal stress UspA family protein